MMVTVEFHKAFFLLLVVSRLLIGVGFVGIAIELCIIVRALGGYLLFRRTVMIFATFIGTCGLSRLVDGYLLLSMLGGPIPSHEMLIWVFDSISAVVALSAMIILFPVMWNATGGHCKIPEL